MLLNLRRIDLQKHKQARLCMQVLKSGEGNSFFKIIVLNMQDMGFKVIFDH